MAKHAFGRWIPGLAAAALTMALVLAQAARAQEAAGQWSGTLRAGGIELRIGVTIERGADGALTGRLVSPDQGNATVPIQDIKVEGGVLSFASPAIRGRFEGRWDPAAESWAGTWTQLAPLPLTLAKGPPPTRLRPQVPQPPYPYRAEDVAIDSAPGVRLACTLTTPQGKGRFPAAVLITGSGAQDRDESLLGHKPFLVLADHLTRHGIAVLRCDDRGFAKSTGDFAAATSRDFAADARADVAFLRARPGIDPRRVGLIGHSEGGLIAPLVAADDPRIAFVVMLAGPGVPSRELMAAQRAAVGHAQNLPAEAVARNDALLSRIDEILVSDLDWEAAKIEVVKLIGKAAAASGQPADALVAQSQLLFTPWYRDFIRYDPRPTLRKLRMPVLALGGSNDVQVLASQNLPAIREALKDDPDATVQELPGLNHLFQHSQTGDPAEYGRIEETFAPSALTTISDWITAHTRR